MGPAVKIFVLRRRVAELVTSDSKCLKWLSSGGNSVGNAVAPLASIGRRRHIQK